jgi:hypothetical protein
MQNATTPGYQRHAPTRTAMRKPASFDPLLTFMVRRGSTQVSRGALRAAIGQQSSGTAPFNHASRSATVRKGRMNRAIPCPPLSTWRPSEWSVTPEVAGSSPVAPATSGLASTASNAAIDDPVARAILLRLETAESPPLLAGLSSLLCPASSAGGLLLCSAVSRFPRDCRSRSARCRRSGDAGHRRFVRPAALHEELSALAA